MAFAETFGLLLFYFGGLYLQSRDLACDFSRVGTYGRTSVHAATCQAVGALPVPEQHLQQPLGSPAGSLLLLHSAARNQKSGGVPVLVLPTPCGGTWPSLVPAVLSPGQLEPTPPCSA